jgi:hypothetical protein
VITEAGTDRNVAGLVYIAAFAPDAGESINTLTADPPPGAPAAPLAPQDGFLSLDKEKFPAAFAADVDAEYAAFMADSQVPWGVGAIATEVASRPGDYGRAGGSSPPTTSSSRPTSSASCPSGRGSSVVEIEGNDAIYVSDPTAVAELIQTAVTELRSTN